MPASTSVSTTARTLLPASFSRTAGYGFTTQQVHGGDEGLHGSSPHGDRVAPIHVSAGFRFEDSAAAAARFTGEEDGFVYSRIANPTTAALERRLAVLEGGAEALVVGSGQAAITTALLGLLQAGDHLLASDHLYEGSRGLFAENFARFGIAVDFVHDHADPAAWQRLLRPTTRALFAESLSNPRNEVLDVAAVAEVAHAHGVPLVVDNTLATPYLMRPLEHGADVVVHSASKFLSGHGTALGGAVVGGRGFAWDRLDAAGAPLFPQLAGASAVLGGRSWVDLHGERAYVEHARHGIAARFGPTLSPFNAFLVQQGVETLSLRMAQHSRSAALLAGWLERQPAVLRVDHASLASSPSAERARRYLPRGSGAVLAVTLRGGAPAARRFIEALQLFSHMTHLGDVRSLVVHPASTTHAHRTEAERERAGIGPGTVRLSVGIEDVEDLQADLRRALVAAELATPHDASLEGSRVDGAA
ncbi:O-acetylhomoserine sulfhydrylase [Quadrisphaera granulorum]|uniref:homocysteine desulfhydrase n=1 Tax=Quadrisphaera granulorum TaxID=317664 RepID=A0A315ZUQ7_9ACTN|nr:aminotransferase class I/II-fold pyridoxal phosphate-dependent enzyme [Quadrisphaera granulorum]PWJ49062.1 O-acetylhomoserine sulfhydrylase [Quadrisphaera granulorum]SZE98272.1 O-acetylhomoserine sulfhydrylase [Quadrisphaera granulorum]